MTATSNPWTEDQHKPALLATAREQAGPHATAELQQERDAGSDVANDRYTFAAGAWGTLSGGACAWTLSDGQDCGGPPIGSISTDGNDCPICAVHRLEALDWFTSAFWGNGPQSNLVYTPTR